MKLLTAKLLKEAVDQDPINRRGREKRDAKVIAKLFLPGTSWTWYVISAELIYDEDSSKVIDIYCYGLVKGLETEFGYFSLNELASLKVPGGFHVERDLYWEQITVKELKEKLGI